MTPKRIVVSPLRFIGDGVLTVPVLRALRNHFEHARIDVLIPPSMANLFEQCPYINDMLVAPGSLFQLHSLLKSRQYDVGILMRRSVSEAFVLKAAGVRHLIGYDEQRFPKPLSYRRWGWFLDEVIPFPPLKTDIPQVKTYLRLLEPLGIAAADERLELWADAEDKLKVAALMDQHQINTAQPVAVFHATSASREKALTADKYLPTLQLLHQRGFQIVALGAAADLSDYTELSRLAGVPIMNLCGQTTLRQSYAFLLQTQLLVSLDSAPVHMAAAAGVPHIVAIYGPIHHEQWQPWPYTGSFTPVYHPDLTCRPCLAKVCAHNRCRTDLSPLWLQKAVEIHVDAMDAENRTPV